MDSQGALLRHPPVETTRIMKRLKLKTSPSSYGLASLQHPLAPLGMHGDTITYMVIDIPDGVTTATVLQRFNETITVRGEIYHYGDLGAGKIVDGHEGITEASAHWIEERAEEANK